MFNEFDNGKFLTVRFTDPSQQYVEAVWEDSKTKEARLYVSDFFNLNDNITRAITRQFTLDDIIEKTKEADNIIRREMNEVLIEAAKQRGLIYEPGSTTLPNTKLSINAIFDLPEGSSGQNFLFELKSRVFELQVIADSKNVEYKQKIRDATSPIEVLYWAGKFLYE
jgi:hypothetical protein